MEKIVELCILDIVCLYYNTKVLHCYTFFLPWLVLEVHKGGNDTCEK